MFLFVLLIYSICEIEKIDLRKGGFLWENPAHYY